MPITLAPITRRSLLAGLAASVAAPAVVRAQAVTLNVWHDLGDNGVRWFNELNELYRRSNAGVTIQSASFPTDQWFGRVIAAINSGSAPDLIFNNYERVIRVMTQTQDKIVDLAPELARAGDTSFLGEADRRIATYRNRMIIFPVQRVQMALGARKTWLERAGEQFPNTWEDILRVARKFQGGPQGQGGGGAATFGFALQAANPRDLIHMLDLFMFGTGLEHTVIDPQGQVVINEPRHKQVLVEFLKVFTEYRLVSPETINHSFTDMYRMILGGRAGFFRVGDWNVNGWDQQQNGLGGDFVCGKWPAFRAGDQNAVVIGGMRGVAVPENAPSKAAAIDFARFLLTREAQSLSLKHVGSAVRSDIEMEQMSERRMYFARQRDRLVAYDFPESILEYYPQLESSYHRKLLTAIATPPSNWDSFVAQTGEELQTFATQNSRR